MQGRNVPPQRASSPSCAAKKETDDFRDRLATALALASRPPVAVNWDRLKEEADADFAAGRSVTFETPEDMLKGLGGCD